MITLAIDASTYAGSVCVTRARAVVTARDVPMRDAQRERLMPAVAEVLEEARLPIAKIDRIVCGGGPGSFTSLRIAGAIAKGLAVAAAKPLYAVSSLALLVGAVEPALASGEYVAILDALRGEYYTVSCLVNTSGDVVDVGPVELLAAADVELLERAGRMVVGHGRRVHGTPSARGVTRVEAILEREGPIDVATWEPSYGRVAEAQRRWEAAHGRSMPHA